MLYLLTITEKGLKWVNGKKICKGKFPEARFDHTMELLHQHLIILGGRSGNDFVRTVYLLDLEKLIWTNLKYANEDFVCRAEHASTVSRDEDKIYIFGGVNEGF